MGITGKTSRWIKFNRQTFPHHLVTGVLSSLWRPTKRIVFALQRTCWTARISGRRTARLPFSSPPTLWPESADCALFHWLLCLPNGYTTKFDGNFANDRVLPSLTTRVWKRLMWTICFRRSRKVPRNKQTPIRPDDPRCRKKIQVKDWCPGWVRVNFRQWLWAVSWCLTFGMGFLGWF